MFEFEFDRAKGAANMVKHGTDFIAAQAIWRDVHRIEVLARTTDEPRWMVIGQAAGPMLVSSSYLPRQYVRIISVRRSRESEVAI